MLCYYSLVLSSLFGLHLNNHDFKFSSVIVHMQAVVLDMLSLSLIVLIFSWVQQIILQ